MKVPLGFALLLTCFSLGHCVLDINISPEEQLVLNELLPHQDLIRNSIASSLFGKNVIPTDTSPAPEAELTCTLCRTALWHFIGWMRQGLPRDTIAERAINLCNLLELLPKEGSCVNVIDLYLDLLLDIFHDRTWLTRVDVCGIIMGATSDRDCRAVNESMINWDIRVDREKPPVVDIPLPPDNITPTKVIHLADVHLDLHYQEGSLADCGHYLCCRPSENDDPSNNATAAGPWGDYRDCDQPYQAVEAVFEDAATRHQDAEFIIFTGDLTHHQIWRYTKEDNLDHFNGVFDILRQQFGNKKTYPVVGNHEPVPCNVFPTRDITSTHPQYNISWVYNALADEFAHFLTPSALETFRQAGYYTILHKPGFRIISLNTNFCYTLNFWLIHSPHDPEDQLQWLSDRLDEAEKNQELVWIIGHVPPGSSNCWYYWGQKYNKLINRYEGIIKAQYYGHTHNDELRIFFDMEEKPPRPTGSLYITTSVTPYSFINPGYKVFYADGVSDSERNATWEIVDHEAWIYNLTDANLRGGSVKPTFFKEYSAKEIYGLRSFRPNDLYELVERMAQNDATFQTYYRLFQMSYDGAEACTTAKCKLDFLCPIVQTDYSDVNCDRLKQIMDAAN